MNGPPNDIIQWKRDKLNYQRHVKRLQSVKPCVDINPPSSLGLKHLETRAKKKQLQEDRQQVVARQNKVLMDNMMAIMAERRSQGGHYHQSSLNERERKHQVEKTNRDNEVMLQRLRSAAPMISSKKFEEEFQLHKKMGTYLRRKQRSLNSVDSSIHSNGSPTRLNTHNSTFDAEAYMARFGSSQASANENAFGSPITSMSEFRKHVISSKRLHTTDATPTRKAGELSPIRATNKKEIRFELSHEPLRNQSV